MVHVYGLNKIHLRFDAIMASADDADNCQFRASNRINQLNELSVRIVRTRIFQPLLFLLLLLLLLFFVPY